MSDLRRNEDSREMTLRLMFECPECGRLKDQREQGGGLKQIGWCHAWKDHEGERRRQMRRVLIRVVNRDPETVEHVRRLNLSGAPTTL